MWFWRVRSCSFQERFFRFGVAFDELLCDLPYYIPLQFWRGCLIRLGFRLRRIKAACHVLQDVAGAAAGVLNSWVLRQRADRCTTPLSPLDTVEHSPRLYPRSATRR